MSWWEGAVVLQVYPRSFQDSDGDGEGDLPGVTARLEHVAWLGADAVWLSPIYPSPLADGGYDVADFRAVHPRFGTLADLDALVVGVHERGLRLLLDAVPCHTSIEHPWFREHPERYIFSPVDGPANNWVSSFGGSAWSRDPHGRGWYLHSFYPEQPDLDWRNPEVARAYGEDLRFWLDRGVDGFRVDAIDRLLKDPELRDDPPATGPPALPAPPEYAALEHVHSHDAPDVGEALAAIRSASGDVLLVGEVYLPAAGLGPYLEHLDVCFAFELLHASFDAASLRAAIEGALALGPGRVAWVLSNHDFRRLPDRVGERNVRAAALLLLTLPGTVFLFAGDEIGTADGPGREPPDDRFGRDPHRHPVAWDDTPHAGFTTGDPWLPAVTPPEGSVAGQREDPGSILHLYRDLIALRRELSGGVEWVAAERDVVAFRRGEHLVAVNVGGVDRPAPRAAHVVRHTHGATQPPATLAPGEGFVGRS